MKKTFLPVPNEIHPKSLVPQKIYPIIDVPATGIPDWYNGAFTLCFVYSKNNGNFILRGYRGEVEKYLKEHYKYYFCYWSMWSDGCSRGHWKFWKDNIGIFEPSKLTKTWKYKIRPYHTFEMSENVILEKCIFLKRLPKHWIPEFDKL